MHCSLKTTEALALIILRDVFSIFLTAFFPVADRSLSTVPKFITQYKNVTLYSSSIITYFLTFRESSHIIRDKKNCEADRLYIGHYILKILCSHQSHKLDRTFRTDRFSFSNI